MANKRQPKLFKYIRVNEIFDELSHENQRLNNELIFANKCLQVFDDLKTHLNKIHTNYTVFISYEEKQEFSDLIQRCDTLVKVEKFDVRSVTVSRTAGAHLEEQMIQRLPSIETKSEHFLTDCDSESLDPIKDNQKYIPSYEEREKYLNAKTGTYRCPKCGLKSRTKALFLLHFYKNHRKPDLCCDNPYCNQIFQTKKALLSHSLTHRKEILYCSHENCLFQTNSGLEMRLHLMTHSMFNLFKCDLNGCNHTYKSLESLTKHLKSHKKRKTIKETKFVLADQHYDRTLGLYKCLISDCNKTFGKKYNLNKHLQTHNDSQYKCQTCSRLFKNGKTYENHIKAHSDGKQIECTYEGCTFRTIDKKYLSNHILSIHSTDFPFKCDFENCHKKFKIRSRLNVHMKEHLAEPVIKCRFPGCEQRFFRYKEQDRHYKRVHNFVRIKRTYDKQISCDWPGCEFLTTTKCKLLVHRTIHTGEKAFVCEFPACAKSFRLKKGYIEHRNTHLNVKPCKCQWPGCQYSSAFSANVVKHVKQVHTRVTNNSVRNNGSNINLASNLNLLN